MQAEGCPARDALHEDTYMRVTVSELLQRRGRVARLVAENRDWAMGGESGGPVHRQLERAPRRPPPPLPPPRRPLTVATRGIVPVRDEHVRLVAQQPRVKGSAPATLHARVRSKQW